MLKLLLLVLRGTKLLLLLLLRV
jgi:hypothetical protein